jgi:large subunit ribosomal protein L9
MELILKQDIKGLGYKNDIVKVKNGYGLNYLIPQGLAVIASKPNVKMRNEDVKQSEHKANAYKSAAETISEQIKDFVLKIAKKAGDNGRIYGTVTTVDIADALKAKGYDIDRRKISMSAHVKEIGSYTAEIDLHREVQTSVSVEVVAED